MSGLPWLDNTLWFPDPDSALFEPDGLLCAGGDLSEDRLVAAYMQGIFPWFSDHQPILWWSPDPRCILKFENLHISKSMRRVLKNPSFRFTFDTCFADVIRGCAEPRSYSEDTWIGEEMIEAYSELHLRGIAHSIEVWHAEKLIGGLYGISLGRCFFGESMFSREPNASKYALINLALSLEKWGCALFDCQLPNPHLSSLGATVISRKEFLKSLHKNIDSQSIFPWR
jgi:leucyl/phenylalanyl-tRNA---protein transferase